MGQTAINHGEALSDREEDRRIAAEFRERQSADQLRLAFMLHEQYGTTVKIVCGEDGLAIPVDERGGVFTHLLYKESGFRSHIKDTRSNAE